MAANGDTCQAGSNLTSLGGELITPSGVATDAAGNVYVADTGNDRIQEFGALGNFLRAWGKDVVSAGPGNTGTGPEICVAANGDTCRAGSHATALGGEMKAPSGVATDVAGEVYVADTSNDRMQKFTGDDSPPPDTTPPDTSIDSGPAAGSKTNQTSAAFTYSGSPSGDVDHFQCKLDSGSFSNCPSAGKSYSGLAEGPHSFSVRAVDAAANADGTPASVAWTVDTTPPDTSIDSGPAAGSKTNKTSAAFTYSGSPSGDVDHFQCKLDSGSFSNCPSAGKSYSGLAEGPHSFSVRAVDAAANADGTPASVAWTVDTTPPDTSIDSGPAAGSKTNKTSAAFTYSGSPSGDVDHFQCKLDSGSFSNCPSAGKSYSGLAEGPHSFSVRAVDAAANADGTPASVAWTVDTTPPDTSIDSGPAAGSKTNQTSAAFTYSGSPSGDVDHFQCKLDSGSFSNCPPAGKSYSGLADGPHSFSVRAVDAAANADGTPASVAWTVDTTPPDTSITKAKIKQAKRSAKFKFTSGEGDSTYQCKIDRRAFALCSSPATYKHLKPGKHKFSVESTDSGRQSRAIPGRQELQDQGQASPSPCFPLRADALRRPLGSAPAAGGRSRYSRPWWRGGTRARCPRTTRIPIGPGRGGRRRPSTTSPASR